MVDETKVKELLTDLLNDVAAKAREDALQGRSNIGSIFSRDRDTNLRTLDVEKAEQAIRDIEDATATKEGARRLVNAIMVAAKTVAKVYYPS